jgi:hypothetical protein
MGVGGAAFITGCGCGCGVGWAGCCATCLLQPTNISAAQSGMRAAIQLVVYRIINRSWLDADFSVAAKRDNDIFSRT